MALRAKVRGQWRIVSPAMARRFRARGKLVEDDAKAAGPPKAPERLSAPALPPPPTAPARVAVNAQHDERDLLAARGGTKAPAPAPQAHTRQGRTPTSPPSRRRDDPAVAPRGEPAKPAELTDDELERLTKPRS